MLDKLMSFVARVAVGDKVVKAIAYIHDKLDGKRSEIACALLAIVHLLKVVNVMPAETAQAIEAALLAILPVVVADRASKVAKLIDGAIPKPK